MPALGADMESGKVVQWRVRPGDRVHPGDVVAVVETHKGAIDVEIFLDGVIDELAPLGVPLLVGARLAVVRAPEADAPLPPGPPAGAVPAEPRMSPAARARARQLGIAPGTLGGTGPDGTVLLADVEAAARREPDAATSGTARPSRGFDPLQMRAAIAAAMSRSKREIPHYYLTRTIDFGEAEEWLARYNAGRPPAARLLPAALMLKSVACALVEVPQFNGFYEDGAARLSASIHIGWAIALRGGGLVAPAVHDADRKSVAEAMAALRDLVQRARAGGLRSSELTDPTVTVTNLGDRGADGVLGVIYPPQLALLGFGRITQRPWVREGRLMARPTLLASLAADHRASDGHLGGQLLAAIDRGLQEPARLEGSAS